MDERGGMVKVGRVGASAFVVSMLGLKAGPLHAELQKVREPTEIHFVAS